MPTELTFTDELVALPIGDLTVADDSHVVAAARVSTQGIASIESLVDGAKEGAGLIRFLMRNKHGTPFEHNNFTFLVSAPITVFREFHRHRIGWSYNEESGRYKQLEPRFYVPNKDRPLVQQGKPGAYTFVPGTPEQYEDLVEVMGDTYAVCYGNYEHLLSIGIAKEVARGVLPVNIYTSMYATCNARSLMSFLSLRTNEPEAAFPSKPMWEIEQVARQFEAVLAATMPITYDAFCDFGRVAP